MVVGGLQNREDWMADKEGGGGGAMSWLIWIGLLGLINLLSWLFDWPFWIY